MYSRLSVYQRSLFGKHALSVFRKYFFSSKYLPLHPSLSIFSSYFHILFLCMLHVLMRRYHSFNYGKHPFGRYHNIKQPFIAVKWLFYKRQAVKQPCYSNKRLFYKYDFYQGPYVIESVVGAPGISAFFSPTYPKTLIYRDRMFMKRLNYSTLLSLAIIYIVYNANV